MRQHHATRRCMGGWAQARKGTPASCFEAFLLFMDTCRFHTPTQHCISKMLCVFTRPGEGHFFPLLCYPLYFPFLLER